MASNILPGLRRAVIPKLSKDFFICHRCRSLPRTVAPQRIKSNFSQTIRHSSTTASSSSLGALARNITPKGQTISASKDAGRSFPEVSSKSVAYWLLGSAASVFGIVVLGGLTRLTESGLSITEWKPLTGSLPPMSDEDWDSEFTKYKSSPEYKQLNPHMNLAEFKKIYFMEWAHRLWGRVVGLSFIVPAVYFVARRKVSAKMSLRLLGISGLIGFQGVIGWWMVKSGLVDDLFAPGSHPRVSQYRLAAHLGTAFVCYSAMLWSGLSILKEHRILANPSQYHEKFLQLTSKNLSGFRKSIAGLGVLVFVTVLSGALVAGLDAGLIYNEWPTMAGGLHPPKAELFDKFYCRNDDGSDLFWRNMLENPSTVQLNHRTLATTTFFVVMSLFAWSRFGSKVAKNLPKDAKRGMLGVAHLVTLQATLGICTLIYLVPTHLAATHQAGSLALLTGVLVLGNRLWVPKSALTLVERQLRNSSATITPAMRSQLSSARKADPHTI